MGIIDRDHASLFHDDKAFDLDGIGQQKGFENLDDELDSLLEHSTPSSPLSSNADTATDDSDAGPHDLSLMSGRDDDDDDVFVKPEGAAFNEDNLLEWRNERERSMSYEVFGSIGKELQDDTLGLTEYETMGNFVDQLDGMLPYDSLTSPTLYHGKGTPSPQMLHAHFNELKTPRGKMDPFGSKLKPTIVAGNTPVSAVTRPAPITVKLTAAANDVGAKRIGIYTPEARKARIARFHAKRAKRVWRKRIKYDCRKKLADSRPRIKGRFVRREDMEEMLSTTSSAPPSTANSPLRDEPDEAFTENQWRVANTIKPPVL